MAAGVLAQFNLSVADDAFIERHFHQIDLPAPAFSFCILIGEEDFHNIEAFVVFLAINIGDFGGQRAGVSEIRDIGGHIHQQKQADHHAENIQQTVKGTGYGGAHDSFPSRSSAPSSTSRFFAKQKRIRVCGAGPLSEW